MTMESEGVLLPLIHDHPMILCNDMRRGDCCKLYKDITEGYYCKSCDFFFHKKCAESSKFIQHPSHSAHLLRFGKKQGQNNICDLCEYPGNLFYHCETCDFDIDLKCIDYPPPEVIDVPEMHHHKLTLLKEQIEFDCDAKCGKNGCGFPYKCHECDLSFHLDCVLHPTDVNRPLEVNHSYHSLHPLKLFKGETPAYSDGKCRLCGKKIDDKMFYHCFSCKFNLDMCCVLNPPPQSILDLKTHDHQLTLFPRLDSFTCNACGLKGDRSPYVCLQCGFMIHQSCVGLPRVININRHDHRVSRTYVLGIVDPICRVCRQNMDWAYGGYSCQKCPNYVVHSKCATGKYVWNGIELEGVPEETENIEPYVKIDDNTIQHFSHRKHHLRLNVTNLQWDNNKRCSACTHPICLQSFYGCMVCDFILHQTCAELPKKKRHVLHNERLTLLTNVVGYFQCDACYNICSGFMYKHEDTKIDVRCGSISEPFIHPSHPHHPLYYILSSEENEICSACNEKEDNVLTCIEDGCGYKLGFECATYPQVIKHRVDDHPLSLCFGEKPSGKYWCDICEKETNPATWFYTCKNNQASLHIECVLGNFAWLMPGITIDYWGISYLVVLNNSISRPFCISCKSHCIPNIILKMLGKKDGYICSLICGYNLTH